MSDYNSSLPVRTEQNGDVAAFIADGTTPSQLLGVDASGRLTVKLDDGSGNAITSQVNGTQQALDVGINVAGVQIDPRSIRALTASDVVSAAQSGSWSVTANAGTDLNTSLLALDTSVNGILLGQGSSTSGQFGPLIQGAVTTSAPSYTNGQTSPLSLTTGGLLRTEATVSGSVDVSNFPTTVDTDFGLVGANTIRTASEIGNATGAADFDAGATSAQTLRVEANQGASASAANGWYVKPTDGTNSQSYTASGEAKVEITQPLPAGTNAIGSITNTSFEATQATAANLNATVVGTGTFAVQVSTALPSGSNTIGNVGVTNLPTTVDTNFGAVGSSTIRTASEIGNSTGGADFGNGATGAQTLRVAANLAVGGSNVSGSNPVPVTITSTTLGTPVQDYHTSASLAAGSSITFTYTVPSGSFSLERIWSSGSGKIKAVADIAASPIMTGFNSTANPNIDMTIVAFPSVAASSTVNVTITNRDNQPQDVYCTIEGNLN